MFENKIVIITGGTRGIGLATAKAFKKEKAKVIVFGSKQKSVDEVSKENGFEPGYSPSLTDFTSVLETMKSIENSYGKIDILVNNAGVASQGSIEDLSAKDIKEIIDLNLNGVIYCSKAVVPIMKNQNSGVILNTSSMVGTYGQASGIGYPASKFGVNGVTKSLALELAKYNIRVNAVAPGIIQTDMLKSVKPEAILYLLKTIPLGRIGIPEDVANTFLFLASEKASYITGAIIPVDGGAKP